ncbi:hypothetical protein SCHPADRAFT_999369 [Schizopora paradoxa]|uniref:BTB domain-containing protein n=1 Tax=Schizopora paradoxa TaxID=27342 RepID=A0A0H2RMS8_9AGAM|nr:hypothetical protein SCHPADRAFT_999369 [Schizopora paradoxa]
MSAAEVKKGNANQGVGFGEAAEPSQKQFDYEKDELFYCTPLVIFRVEDRLFRIPQELLETHSEVFRTMFTLPTGQDGGDSGEGRSESKPLYLEGVKKTDFRNFLQVLTALNYEDITPGKTRGKTYLMMSRFPLYHDLNTDDWIAVLRLATMWNFDNVRSKAMRVLEEDTSIYLLDRLKLAYDLDITSSSWLLPIYRNLVKREVPVTQKEAPWLSDDFIKKITRLREERLKSLLVSLLSEDVPKPTCYKCKNRLYRPASKDLVLSGGAPRWDMFCKSCNMLIGLDEAIHGSPALEKEEKNFENDLDQLIDLFLPTSKND